MYKKAVNVFLNVIVMASINYISRLNMSLVHLMKKVEFNYTVDAWSKICTQNLDRLVYFPQRMYPGCS